MRDGFVTWRGGKKYVLYAGLLEEAHALGLKEIDTDLVQVPAAENGYVAVVKAVVKLADGRTFHGIGDASPESVGRGIVPHTIRMAETRAKARALRDAVNVDAAALEELTEGGAEGAARGAAGGRPERHMHAVEDPPAERAPRRAAAEERRPGDGDRKKIQRRHQKADKERVELLRKMTVELRGEGGVARFEGRIGKRIEDLTKAEAEEWIQRLTPSEGAG